MFLIYVENIYVILIVFYSSGSLTLIFNGLISSIASHLICPFVSGISSKYNNGSPMITRNKLFQLLTIFKQYKVKF